MDIFEIFLKRYSDISDYKRPSKKKIKIKIEILDKPLILVSIVLMPGLVTVIVSGFSEFLGRTGKIWIIAMGFAGLLAILSGRIWMKPLEEYEKEIPYYRSRLDKVYAKLTLYGINTREQIAELSKLVKEYQPGFIKSCLVLKKIGSVIFLQLGIPALFFVLGYLTSQDTYQLDTRLIILILVLGILYLGVLCTIVAMFSVFMQELFMKKKTLADALAKDLDMILIFYPIK